MLSIGFSLSRDCTHLFWGDSSKHLGGLSPSLPHPPQRFVLGERHLLALPCRLLEGVGRAGAESADKNIHALKLCELQFQLLPIKICAMQTFAKRSVKLPKREHKRNPRRASMTHRRPKYNLLTILKCLQNPYPKIIALGHWDPKTRQK